MTNLLAQRCRHRGPGEILPPDEIAHHLAGLPGWALREGALEKRFEFPDYHRTLAFVNAQAWIAHAEDHHPDAAFGYNHCTLRFSTHSAGGVTLNDLICAAKVDALQP
jgi:4a-hydroxytetrahydrobiopterin dehydratase